MGEIQTADSSGGVENKSEQQLQPPTPKQQTSAKGSKRSGSSSQSSPKTKAPKLNERGVPETNWDNNAVPPTERKHIGESPDGKGNEKK